MLPSHASLNGWCTVLSSIHTAPQDLFSEEHIQALLDVNLGSWLGILVAGRTVCHKARNAGEKFEHRLHPIQPLIPPDAKVLIAVVQQSSQMLSDDAERRKAARRRQRSCVTLTPEQQVHRIRRKRGGGKSEFLVLYDQNHFQRASIDGIGTLIVDELSSSSH